MGGGKLWIATQVAGLGYGVLAWLKHILLMYEPEKMEGEGRRKRRRKGEESSESESE